MRKSILCRKDELKLHAQRETLQLIIEVVVRVFVEHKDGTRTIEMILKSTVLIIPRQKMQVEAWNIRFTCGS